MRRLYCVLVLLMCTGAALAEDSTVFCVLKGVSLPKYHRCDCELVTNDTHDQFQRTSLEEVARRELEPHAACAPPAYPDGMRPVSLDAFKACAQALPAVGRVKVDGMLGAPSLGASGQGFEDYARVRVDASGKLAGEVKGGLESLRRGEVVTVSAGRRYEIKVSSALKHNVTRGQGASRHESPEEVGVLLEFLPPRRDAFDCSVLKKVWDESFELVGSEVLAKLVADNPSGVLVEEVRAGMKPAEVEALLGPPERRAVLPGKTVYFYPRMKVTFVGGQVTDVE